MNLNYIQKKWFTLVELIIVIAILSILSAVWFVSLQKYLANARDAARYTNIKDISDSLSVFHIRTWKFPAPDSSTTIMWKTTVLWYQGTVWKQVSNLLNFNKVPKDPGVWDEYIYYTNPNKTKFQLLFFSEN